MNLQVNWPAALVVVAVIASTTVLGLRGVIPPVWIEHTLTAMVGILLGIPLGRMRSPPQAERDQARKAAPQAVE